MSPNGHGTGSPERVRRGAQKRAAGVPTKLRVLLRERRSPLSISAISRGGPTGGGRTQRAPAPTPRGSGGLPAVLAA
jgi:hypothetical protein